MNKKISWGLVITVFGILYLLEISFPGLLGDLKREISNLISFKFLKFEFIVLFMGIVFLIKRKIILGLVSIYIAGKMIFEYSQYFLPLFIVLVGLIYIFLGIEEKNRREEKK